MAQAASIEADGAERWRVEEAAEKREGVDVMERDAGGRGR
jgi:hypothetical protein